ncbi:MAG: acylneuraminate cytidylyltransferase family protein [Rhodospirillales bacterium]|nr:acylneuraminate cytidylyltransferase family protein [Rhodospirillales bacterium]
MSERIIAVIPARGGSKGIPGKNIKDFCRKPLIAWTIEQAKSTSAIDNVYVSSDSSEIIQIAESYGAEIIRRPNNISGDTATTESALAHALVEVGPDIGAVMLLQPTSPLRKPDDLAKSIELFQSSNFDSLFSGAELQDFLIWKKSKSGALESINYDHKNRGRRQEREVEFVENGSIYISKPELITTSDNRLGENIGVYLMDFWQSFELDDIEEWDFLEVLYRHYLADADGL